MARDGSATPEAARDDRLVLPSGISLHVRVHGPIDGEPVLFLHGVLASAVSYDALCASLASTGRRVVALDQRGHGESDGAEDYAWERWVEDIAGVVELLGLGAVDLVGHSMGAGHAAHFAGLHPDLVRRLALLDGGVGRPDSPSEGDYWSRVAQLFPVDGFESLSGYVDTAMALFPRADRIIVEQSSQRFVRGDSGRWRWPLQADMSIVSLRTEPSPEQETEMRASVTCPTLVARAEFSELFTAEPAAHVVDEYANGIHQVLRGTGHMIMWEAVGSTVAVLTDFLR